MNKSELIDKWQKKHSSILEDYNYRYRGGNNTLAASECRGRMKDVLDFIEDIKNINGETVKLGETCSRCGGIKDLVSGNLCKMCQSILSESKSSEA